MPLVRVDNLSDFGIIKDVPGYDLPPEAWTDGQNIRFREKAVIRIDGQQTVFGSPSVTPYSLQFLPGTVNSYWIYGGLAKVYVTDGSTHYNITRQTASVDVDYSTSQDTKWNGGILHGIPILNNAVDTPQMWLPADTGNRLAALSAWPASTTAKVLRVFKNFILALDVTESGTRYPTVLRWSHPADPGAVPASWDYTDATKDAGRVPISDSGGWLLDAVKLGNSCILYKEDSVHLMQYVGGQYIMAFQNIFSDIGLLATNCAIEISGRHFVVTPDDIIVHSGREPKSMLDNKWRTSLFNSIDPTYKVRSFVFYNPKKAEVWFCYPEIGNAQPNVALVINTVTGVLTKRGLGGQCPHAALGGVNPGAISTDWGSDSASWDSDTTIWDARTYDPAFTSGLLAQSDTARFSLIDSTNQFNGSNFTSFVERTGLSIVGRDRQGNWKVEPDAVKFVKRLIPRVRASGPITVHIGGTMAKDAAISWEGPFTFNPATDYEIPCSVTAKFLAVRFEFPGNISASLDGYELDMEVIGRY